MSATLERQSDPQLDEAPPFPVRRWTLEEFHALIDQGMFDEERVELLEGWIVPRMVHKPIHDGMISLIEEELKAILPPGTFVRIQSSILAEESQPLPDLAIVNGSKEKFLDQHPCGKDLLLIVEVADSSLLRDRRKATIYARAGVPNYWIVDLRSKMIEVYSMADPAQALYQMHRQLQTGEELEFALGSQATMIRADQLLPPPDREDRQQES